MYSILVYSILYQQHNKLIQSAISIPLKRNLKYIRVFEVLLVGGRGTITSKARSFCLITTCNERRINRVHLTFSFYTNCQSRPCGKEFNTTVLSNLNIFNVFVNIIREEI